MYDGNRPNAEAFAYVRLAKLAMTPERLCCDEAELLLPFVAEVFDY